uniref:PH domain-containing protein n=1 Tax=Onchocerca volvulus TaxID=6282 RepID=A0A2K6WH23_ONCVO
MKAEDIDLAKLILNASLKRIIQRTNDRELFIEKENALLNSKLETSVSQGGTESVLLRPLLNKNQEQSGHSIYPTEELEIMKRISLDGSRNPSSDSLHDACTADKLRNEKLRARFAALAAEVENFECDLKPLRSKESFLKGPSPRLSGGDISPAVLFTPTVSYYSSSSVSSLPRIDEGKPASILNDETIAYADESFDKTNEQEKMATAATVYKSSESLKSSNLLRNTSEKHLRFASPVCELAEIDPLMENCSLHCDSLTKRYPARTELEKNLADDKNPSESDVDNCSETKEYGIHKFFRVRTFSVRNRSDIIDEITVAANSAISTISTSADKSTYAKQMAKQLDEKIDEERLKAKVAPKVGVALSQFEHCHSQSRKRSDCTEIDTRSTNVKSLRDRWEVSSATGTPLHPDQKEDELLQAAIRMTKSLKQERMRPQSYCETKSSVQIPGFRPISAASSTSCIQPTENILEEQLFTVNKEKIQEEEKGSKAITSSKSGSEPNQLIDDAFQFINRTPDKNSSLMSAILSTPEVRTTLSSPAVVSTDHENIEAIAPLAHSVSFYRRKEKENRSGSETVILGQFIPSPFSSTANNLNRAATSKRNMNDRANFEIERARLEEAISVQQEQIVQASRALSFCHNTQEFRGSREEVDAQRALLIATERRRALIFVLDRLIQKHATGSVQHSISDRPKGNLTFWDISVKLMRDFVNGHINYHDDQLLFYFIVLIRCEETVHHTTLTTSDEGICSGRLEFPHYIKFRSLPHDFNCTLEIFSLRTRRELLRHGTKYHIKSGNSLKKSQKSMLSPGPVSLGGPSAVIDPSFQRVGHLSLNISNVHKTRFHLSDTLYPLDGIIEMKVRCHAEDCGTIGHKGFLSLYQPVENIASWSRFWCVLWDGQLRFWRYPEDESTKTPMVSIDLRTCACNEIKPISVERCPYPNSMQIDVWLPGEYSQKPDKIRILMAADRKDEMHSWLNAMNISLRNLSLWSCRS